MLWLIYLSITSNIIYGKSQKNVSREILENMCISIEKNQSVPLKLKIIIIIKNKNKIK